MKDIWINRNGWTYPTIKQWYDEGSFILDDTYNIPSTLAHVGDEDMDVMMAFGIAMIYGVEDETGRCHVNKEDFERYIRLIEGTDDKVVKMRRMRREMRFAIIDWKSDNGEKHNFFKRILTR